MHARPYGLRRGNRHHVALFRKKTSAAEGESSGDDAFVPQPDKARKWFSHAKASADTFNYEYALNCWANGFKFDPEPMDQHEAMHAAAIRYKANGGKPASSKEVKSIDDGSLVGRFAAAEFEWMKNLDDFRLACKAIEAAVKADQLEFGRWMARPAIGLMGRQKKKPSKGMLVALMELLQRVEAFDESIMVGEAARDLDPSDNELAQQLKNLSAERAMSQGGYNRAAGEEGGFREFIKDADKQRELLESETLAAGATTEERNLARAKAAWEETPNQPDAINKYAQLLKKRGDAESIELAHEVYERGFRDTAEYRFRMAAGDIRIEQSELRLRELARKLEERPDDAERRAAHDDARRSLLALKSEEYSSRVERYPTDRFRKFDLGTVRYELGEFDEAMAQFQAAKDEPKLHVSAALMLGRCFMAEGWYGEAIGEFREAIQAMELGDRDRELELRYELVNGLMALARDESSVEHAREAKDLCSEIARKDITFRDIRQKRREIDELLKELG